MSGSAGLGSIRCWSTPRRPGGPGRGWWRNVLDLYGAANILVAEVRLDRLYPGGPAQGACSSAASGPTARSLGSFELTAQGQQRPAAHDEPRACSGWTSCSPRRSPPASSAAIPTSSSSRLRRRRRKRRLRPTPLIQPTVVQVLVTERGDPDAVSQSVAQIRGLAGVIWVTEAPLPDGGANLAVNFRGDATALAVGPVVARLGGHQSGRRSCA